MTTPSFSFLRAQRLSNFNELVFFFFFLVLQNAPPCRVALFAMIAWAVWEHQIRLRERQPIWDIGGVVARASELLQEFHDVHKKFPRMSMPNEIARWSPLVEGLYKVNFDGAIFEDQACAGLGVVIRDSAGLIIGALSQKIRLPSLTVMVEALVAN